MNRLSPLVSRRPRTAAAAYAGSRAAPAPQAAPAVSEDLRMFATTFLGGLAFFGTYLA
jgi:hypothetical protein